MPQYGVAKSKGRTGSWLLGIYFTGDLGLQENSIRKHDVSTFKLCSSAQLKEVKRKVADNCRCAVSHSAPWIKEQKEKGILILFAAKRAICATAV